MQNEKLKIDRANHQKGYTLIEILIASTIFTAVVIIGTTAFSTVNRVKGGGEVLNNLNQTATFIAEDIARNIRSATGTRDQNDNMTTLPFAVEDAAAECNKVGFLDSGTTLVLVHGDSTRSYFVAGQDKAKTLLLMITKVESKSSSLLPNNIYLEQICFYGNDYAGQNRVHPYVFFEFTLVESISGKKQTIRSAVAGREYF